MATDDVVPTMAEREEIVMRLRQLSNIQKLIERSYSGYTQSYEVAPEDLPDPQNVQIDFLLQTLYFQPGVATRLPAYITTTVELNIPQEEDFGLYSLFTNLDGSDCDDTMIWASSPVHTLQKDFGIVKSIEPVELRNVPLEMQDIFPQLASMTRYQRLVDHATERCTAWFQSHSNWYQQYPLSLAEEGHKKDLRWFRKYPLWYRKYPENLFKTPEVRIAFERQVLCFNHAKYTYPHIKTYLNIYAGGYEIGSYCFVTKLDGTTDEDLSMIVPYPFETEV